MTLEEQFDALNRIDVLCNVAKRAIRYALCDDKTLERLELTREELANDIKEYLCEISVEVERLKGGAP